MNFLRLNDYYAAITKEALDQITEGVDSHRIAAELAGLSEMISYLVQRYDTDKAFRVLQKWNTTTAFKKDDRIYFTADAYVSATSYSIDNLVTSGGNIYKSLVNTNQGNAVTDSTKWVNIGADNRIFVAAADNTNTLPTVMASWTEGDDRNPQLVMYLVDIALYHLHKRINPRNIPELRMIRYDGNVPQQLGGAIGWLKMVSAGKISANLPALVPSSGAALTFGSNPKMTHIF